jgi:hypothetical protein
MQKLQITIAYAQIYILLKCAQITTELRIILNLLLQQLVSDNFYLENVHFTVGF